MTHVKHWPVALATHAVRDQICDPTSPSLDRLLERMASAGFAGLDLSDSLLPIDRPGHDWLALRRQVEAQGLVVPALNLLHAGLAFPDHAEHSAGRIRHAIETAAALGAGVLSISLSLPDAVGNGNAYRGGTYGMGSSREASTEDFRRTADHLQPLVETAASAGVALSIEVHHASLADNGKATMRLWDLVGDSRLGVNPDLVNAYWSYAEPEEDWRDTLRLLAPLANLWHVKNVRRDRAGPDHALYRNAPLGDGDIDQRQAISIMRDAGFAGWLSIERGGPEGDAFEIASEGLRFIRQIEHEEQKDI